MMAKEKKSLADGRKIVSGIGDFVKKAEKTATEVTAKTKDAVTQSKDAVLNAIDVNGDGNIDIEDVILLGLRVPGIRINRDEFLRKELFKNYPQGVIDAAVLHTPAYAGISVEEIDKIADEVIKYERNCVSGISAALGMPGGVAMVATVPADIAQYYGYMLRATQKLLYLYGFPEIDTTENNNSLDSETMNILIVCLGVMYSVNGANQALHVMAHALATGVEKKLLNAALTKGTIYPIVKKVASWFAINMNKQIFAGFFKKAIPVVGGVIGGGITYASFKPCCDRLKASLQNTMLSNPSIDAPESLSPIDCEFTDIDEDPEV